MGQIVVILVYLQLEEAAWASVSYLNKTNKKSIYLLLFKVKFAFFNVCLLVALGRSQKDGG